MKRPSRVGRLRACPYLGLLGGGGLLQLLGLGGLLLLVMVGQQLGLGLALVVLAARRAALRRGGRAAGGRGLGLAGHLLLGWWLLARLLLLFLDNHTHPSTTVGNHPSRGGARPALPNRTRAVQARRARVRGRATGLADSSRPPARLVRGDDRARDHLLLLLSQTRSGDRRAA